ncbi:MAG: hypothetical protein AVDCRST_MAG68-5614, partial [uncultured Gemmatimonadetes bacterium]
DQSPAPRRPAPVRPRPFRGSGRGAEERADRQREHEPVDPLHGRRWAPAGDSRDRAGGVQRRGRLGYGPLSGRAHDGGGGRARARAPRRVPSRGGRGAPDVYGGWPGAGDGRGGAGVAPPRDRPRGARERAGCGGARGPHPLAARGGRGAGRDRPHPQRRGEADVLQRALLRRAARRGRVRAGHARSRPHRLGRGEAAGAEPGGARRGWRRAAGRPAGHHGDDRLRRGDAARAQRGRHAPRPGRRGRAHRLLRGGGPHGLQRGAAPRPHPRAAPRHPVAPGDPGRTALGRPHRIGRGEAPGAHAASRLAPGRRGDLARLHGRGAHHPVGNRARAGAAPPHPRCPM